MAAPVDISYAALLSCGTTAPLPATGIGAAAIELIKHHGADAAEVERLTTTWVGSIKANGESWGRITSPSAVANTVTYWQILRWEESGGPPTYWTRDSFSEAVATAKEASEGPGAREVMVTRVVCERLGAVMANGAVYGSALRRLLAPELRAGGAVSSPESPDAGGAEVA